MEHAMAEAGSSNAGALKKDSAERDARTELLAGRPDGCVAGMSVW